jgi:predicted nucleic acid-binding protein
VILIDNTVLSNFTLAQTVRVLRAYCAGKGRVTSQVLKEFEDGVQGGVLPSTNLKWLRRVKLRGREEHALFSQLRTQVGAGEASCLAIAVVRGYSILSDDMRARRIARIMGVAVSGSIGVLLELLRVRRLTHEEGNNLLRIFIEHGYFSPVDRVDRLDDFFQSEP